MDQETQSARERVTRARQAFDEARAQGNRGVYDAKFSEVLQALSAFNHLRDRKIRELGLEIM